MIKMGKKLSGLTDGLMSFAKAMPLIAGAGAGMFVGDFGSSPINDIKNGQYSNAFKQLIGNYTFYNMFEDKFNPASGKGIKCLALGLALHKIIGWIDG